MLKENLLLEDGRRRQIIRSLVKDIIFVFKNEEEGEFYLPNYIEDDKDFYNFTNFGHDIIVELTINQNFNVEDFTLDANYWRDEDIIEVIINYNPKNKNLMLYDLVGELNQIVAHEIRHVDQKYKKTHNLDLPDEKDPFKYYTQPHEIDAQVFGFKRLAKITKKPYETIVRTWFEKNKDIHHLNDEETKEVINILLNKK